MPKELYFFESAFATKNIDQLSGDNDQNFLYHSYNINFPFKFPIRNLKSISLKSFEAPLSITTARINNGTILFPIMFSIGVHSNISKQILIPPGSYTNATLITAINTAITGQLNTPLNYGATITLSTTTPTNTKTGLLITSVAHNCTSLQIQQSTLTKQILGFNTYSASSTSPIIGSSPINVNGINNLLYMQITNLPIMNNNILPFTFKIPLSNVVNATVFYNDVVQHQTIYFNESTFTLTNLNVILLDRFGVPLIGYQDWSFTLVIEYDDDVNKNQIQFLNLNN
jgi:hypothetical protein